MQGLVLADLHAHPHRAHATYKDGMNSRLRDTLRILDHVIEVAKGNCGFVAIAGDLFHVSPPYAEAFNYLHEKISELGSICSVVMIAGNHDLRQVYYSGDPADIPFLKFREIPGVAVLGIDRDVVMVHNDEEYFGIYGYHHQRLDTLKAKVAKATDESAAICLIHQEVAGAKVNGYVFPDGVDPSDFDSRFRFTFCGHIHQPQRISDRFVVPGSPLHLNFGDSGDRGFWLVDTTAETVEMIQTTFPRFITLAPNEEQPDGENFYRVAIEKEEREALKLPGVQQAIDEYCHQKHHMEYVDVGHAIASEIKQDTLVPADFSLVRADIEQFGPFEKATLRLGPGMYIVLGEYAERPGKSNAAGKTTLFEGVSWALYGQTSKGERGSGLMRRQTTKRKKTCKVRVSFTSPRGELIVERTQTTTKSTLTAWFAGKEISGRIPDTQKWLVETLGTPYDFFGHMVYFGQDTAEFFSELGDAGKKEILGTLLGLGWYDEALKSARVKVAEIEGKLETTQTERRDVGVRGDAAAVEVKKTKESINQWQASRASRVHEARVVLNDLLKDQANAKVQYEQEVEAYRVEALRMLEAQQRDHQERRARIKDEVEAAAKAKEDRWADELADLEASKNAICANLHTLPEVEEVEQQLKGIERDLPDFQAKQETARQKLAELRSDLKKLQADRDKTKRILSGADDLDPGTVCQNCGQKITDESKAQYLEHLGRSQTGVLEAIRKVQAEIDETEKKWTETNEVIIEMNQDRQRLLVTQRSISDANIGLLAADEALTRTKTRITAERVELVKYKGSRAGEVEAHLLRERGAVEHTIQEKKASMALMFKEAEERYERQIVTQRGWITTIENEVCPFDEAMTRLRGEMLSLTSKLQELDGDIRLFENELEAYRFWVIGFGRQGIPAALMQGFCKVFTAEANEILRQLGLDISLELSPTTTLKSGDVRDQLNYVIRTETGESTYKLLSGGEKVRVDVTSMLALHSIASRQYAIKNGLFGLLILDEVFSPLDEEGRELVFQMLQQFKARSIFVISHNSLMQSMFSNVLTVRRSKGVSVLV